MARRQGLWMLALITTVFLLLACQVDFMDTELEVDGDRLFAFEIYSQILSKLYVTEISQGDQSAFDISTTRQIDFYDEYGNIVDDMDFFVEGRTRRIIDGYEAKIASFRNNSALAGGTLEWVYWIIEGDRVIIIDIMDVSLLVPYPFITEIRAPERDTILYFFISDGIQTIVEDISNWKENVDPILRRNAHGLHLPHFGVDDIIHVKVETHEESCDKNIRMTLDADSISDIVYPHDNNILHAVYMDIKIDRNEALQKLRFVTRGLGWGSRFGETIETTEVIFNGFDCCVEIFLPEVAGLARQ